MFLFEAQCPSQISILTFLRPFTKSEHFCTRSTLALSSTEGYGWDPCTGHTLTLYLFCILVKLSYAYSLSSQSSSILLIYLFSLVACSTTGYIAAVVRRRRQLHLLLLTFNIALVLIHKPDGSSVKDPSDGLVLSVFICIPVTPIKS